MEQTIYTVLANEKIARDVYKMELGGSTAALKAPGQFIDIKLEGFYLRRPISVCDYEDDKLTIIYKTVGDGTKFMSTFENGKQIDALTGLGNGFDTSVSGDRPLVIGGGVGVPPMYGLVKKLVEEGKNPTVVLGFNSKDDVFYEDEFCSLKDGLPVYVATADGSYGTKGFVTDVIAELKNAGMAETYFYTCGPEPMLNALIKACETEGQLSFEERMGCGFGACMGCSCKTKLGNKRICRDGPVMKKSELL